MTSILKTDEIQSQNGGSVVKMQTLKHPSASGNNLELASDGSTTITNGTLSAGTLGSSVVVPASLSGLKLTKSYSGNLNGGSVQYLVNDCFSTTYDSYYVMMHGQLSSSLSTNTFLEMRLTKNTTGSTNSYWSIVRGWDHNGTSRSITRSNADSLYIVNGVDQDYPWSVTFRIDRPATSNYTFMSGVSGNFRESDGVLAHVFSGYHGTNYSATDFSLHWSVSGAQSTCNINIYGIDG